MTTPNDSASLREEIATCPFCNHGDVVFFPNDLATTGRELGQPRVDAFYGHCESCGMDGPVGDSMDEAITGWNRRAAIDAAGGEPSAYTYRINGTYDGLSFTEPADDAYDEGTLVKHYSRPQPDAAKDAQPIGYIQPNHLRELAAGNTTCATLSPDLLSIDSDVALYASAPDDAKRIADLEAEVARTAGFEYQMGVNYGHCKNYAAIADRQVDTISALKRQIDSERLAVSTSVIELGGTIADLRQQLAALQVEHKEQGARLEAAEKDVARYRYVRQEDGNVIVMVGDGDDYDCPHTEALDERLDAALAKKG